MSHGETRAARAYLGVGGLILSRHIPPAATASLAHHLTKDEWIEMNVAACLSLRWRGKRKEQPMDVAAIQALSGLVGWLVIWEVVRHLINR